MNEKILRKKQLPSLVGLSIPTIWRLEKRGLFPARRQISPGCVGWLQSEIDSWISGRRASSTEVAGGIK